MTTSGRDLEQLRQRAQARLSKTRQDVAGMTPSEIQELVYDLQVHQIELEMQNEALMHAHAETELTRQKYQDLYDQAPVGYLTIDRDDIILAANLMSARLLGCERDSLVGTKFIRFIKADSQDMFYIHKRAVLRTGEKQNCHIEALSSEPLHLHITSQRVDGKTDSYNAVLTDITMMKKLEAHLVQMRDAAEEANVAKSQFLANMSHEIRTPLNAIIGIGRLLEHTPLEEKQAQLVSVLNTSGEGLHAVVNDILDFAKIESGLVELELKPFKLPIVLGDSISLMQVAANDKNLNLSLEYDLSLPVDFLGDAHRLRQIILNLISNALKFTETGGVTVKVYGTAASADEIAVKIDVTDTGIGIPADKTDKVFNKFTQADSSTTRKFGGTGLGLTIAKKLTQQMGGDITVRSELGAGSTFCVELPLRVIFPAPEVAKPYQIKSRPKKALVVDDFAPNLLVLTTYLADLNYECETCADGKEAVNKAVANSYNIIFMDIQMPIMDGIEATRLIRQGETMNNAEATTIIAVSAHLQAREKQKCLDAGMDGYIEKPVRPEDLTEHLSRIALNAGRD